MICYFIRCFSRAERNYCVTRRELLAVMNAIKHFHHYIYGNRFTIRTDHESLRWLLNFKILDGQLARMLTFLSTYDFSIVTMQNRWNNRISDGCVYAQIRKGLGMHLVTYLNHDTALFLIIVPIKGRFV